MNSNDGSEKTLELVSLKATVNDTGKRASFSTDDDFPVTPGMSCVLLMGDEAIAAWADAQNNLREANPDVIDTLLSDVGDLEIKRGAAPEEDDTVSNSVMTPWRFVRNRPV